MLINALSIWPNELVYRAAALPYLPNLEAAAAPVEWVLGEETFQTPDLGQSPIGQETGTDTRLANQSKYIVPTPNFLPDTQELRPS